MAQGKKVVLSDENIASIVRWYRKGVSIIEVAEHFQIHKKRVTRILREQGVTIRKGGYRKDRPGYTEEWWNV